MILCKYCSKDYKSIKMHERFCKSGPYGVIVNNNIKLKRLPSVCNFCNLEFAHNSINNHKIRCSLNPNSLPDTFKEFKKSGKRWNKGLTKLTDDRVLNTSIKSALSNLKRIKTLKESGNYIPPKRSEKFLSDLSKRQSANPKGGRCKWYDVSDQKVQGTWERNIALKFEELNIKWYKLKTTTDVFPYKLEDGTLKHYTPDFYLPEYGYYIEIKGYWRDNVTVEKMKSIKQQYHYLKLLIIEKLEYEECLKI